MTGVRILISDVRAHSNPVDYAQIIGSTRVKATHSRCRFLWLTLWLLY